MPSLTSQCLPDLHSGGQCNPILSFWGTVVPRQQPKTDPHPVMPTLVVVLHLAFCTSHTYPFVSHNSWGCLLMSFGVLTGIVLAPLQLEPAGSLFVVVPSEQHFEDPVQGVISMHFDKYLRKEGKEDSMVIRTTFEQKGPPRHPEARANTESMC